MKRLTVPELMRAAASVRRELEDEYPLVSRPFAEGLGAPLEEGLMPLPDGEPHYAQIIKADKIQAWEKDLLRFMDTQYPQVGQSIEETLRLTDENRELLKEALAAFTQGWEG